MPLSNPLIKDIDRVISQIKTNETPKFQKAQQSQIQSKLFAQLPLEILQNIIGYVIGVNLVAVTSFGRPALIDGQGVNDILRTCRSAHRRDWEPIVNLNERVIDYAVARKCGSRTRNYTGYKGLLGTCQAMTHIGQSIFYEMTLFSILTWHTPGLAYGLGNTTRSLENLPISLWKIRHVQFSEEGGPSAIILSPLLRFLILKTSRLQYLSIGYRELLNSWIPIIRHDWTIEYEFLHLLCRLQGLQRFELSPLTPPLGYRALGRDPTMGYANITILTIPPRRIEDTPARRVHMVLSYVLQTFICGSTRRTLKPGKELKAVVADAQKLFGQLVRCPEVFGPNAELNIPKWLESPGRDN